MKKEDIKRDVIYDKIINFINYINNNQKQVGLTFIIVSCILIAFVFYMNQTETKKLSNNAYSSTYQNNYIDNDKDLALIGFTNILDEYPQSETYNQAFIYVLSDAIENNEKDKIASLISNNKFNTNDPMLKSMYYKVMADYYESIDELNNAVSSYKDAIKHSSNKDYIDKYKISLISLYINLDNHSKARNIVSDIDIDDLSYDNKNKFEDIKAQLEYNTN